MTRMVHPILVNMPLSADTKSELKQYCQLNIILILVPTYYDFAGQSLLVILDNHSEFSLQLPHYKGKVHEASIYDYFSARSRYLGHE